MPAPDPARLGTGSIHLNAEVVHFAPRRREAWRGVGTVSLPYAEVLSLVMTEPQGFSRGRLTVRLNNGDAYAMSFGSNRLPKMRRVYREFWRRVQEVRGQAPGPGQ